MLTHPILAEADAAERRVVAERDGRGDFRRRYRDAARDLANETRVYADENGVEFVEGQRVESLTELWFALKPGTPMMCAGWTGKITRIADNIASIAWDGIEASYLIRRDQMRRTMKVVKV